MQTRISGRLLSPKRAVEMYREGRSVCQIAEVANTKRITVENKIRAMGVRGLRWCAIHSTYEVLN